MINSSKKSNYYFTYSNPNIKDLGFNIQEIQFPDINLDEILYSSSFGNIHLIGDKIEYGTLNITAIIDEDFLFFTKLLDEVFTHKNVEENEIDLKKYVGVLHITSNKGNPLLSFTFDGAFIKSISGVSFSDLSSDEPMTCNVEITFSALSYKRII